MPPFNFAGLYKKKEAATGRGGPGRTSSSGSAAPASSAPAPPGMIMPATNPAQHFQTYVSPARAPGQPPFQRLILVSSRVRDPMAVVRAALPSVGVICYDWRRWQLHELSAHVRHMLGGSKVTSIAVVAPGPRAGGVGIMEGWATHWDSLAAKREQREFWKAIAKHVEANSAGDGGRVDLLGCRLEEGSGGEGALLLKELWKLTGVPFACSDDAASGYQLKTFSERPGSKRIELVASSVQALDLYCDRAVLFGQAAATGAAGPLTRLASCGDNLAALGNLSLQSSSSNAASASAPLVRLNSGSGAGLRHSASQELEPLPRLPQDAVVAPALPAPVSPAPAAEPAVAAPVPTAQVTPVPPPTAEVAPAPPPPRPAPTAAPAAAVMTAPLPMAASTISEVEPLEQEEEEAPPLKPAKPSGLASRSASLPRASSGLPRSASRDSLGDASGEDIFTRIVRNARHLDIDLAQAFRQADAGAKGALAPGELVALAREVVPDASELEAEHVRVMAQIGGAEQLSYRGFRDALDLHRRIQAAVRRHKDPSEVMVRLFDYLFDNEQVMREVFTELDTDSDGLLGHGELQALVALIPGLEPNELKFIMAALYQADRAGDGCMDFDQLLRHVKRFNSRARQYAAEREARHRELREPAEYVPSNFRDYRACSADLRDYARAEGGREGRSGDCRGPSPRSSSGGYYSSGERLHKTRSGSGGGYRERERREHRSSRSSRDERYYY